MNLGIGLQSQHFAIRDSPGGTGDRAASRGPLVYASTLPNPSPQDHTEGTKSAAYTMGLWTISPELPYVTWSTSIFDVPSSFLL